MGKISQMPPTRVTDNIGYVAEIGWNSGTKVNELTYFAWVSWMVRENRPDDQSASRNGHAWIEDAILEAIAIHNGWNTNDTHVVLNIVHKFRNSDD